MSMRTGRPCQRLARARARVLAPISTTGMGPDDTAALRDRTRNVIDAARHELQRELEAERSGKRAKKAG